MDNLNTGKPQINLVRPMAAPMAAPFFFAEESFKDKMTATHNKTTEEIIQMITAKFEQCNSASYQQCERDVRETERHSFNNHTNYEFIYLNSRNDSFYDSEDDDEDINSDNYSEEDSEMSGDEDPDSEIDENNQPAPPKKPLSAFFIYKDDVFEEVKRENPGKSDTELTYLISSKWRECNQETRRDYENKLQRAKKRYEDELGEFEDRYGRGGSLINKRKFVYKRNGDESDEEYLGKKVKNT